MGTRIVDREDLDKPIVRRKKLTVRNDGSMRAEIDAGQFGGFVTDEPVEHGGGGQGPSPLQAVLGALCGCESVTFHRTAQEYGFAYDGIEFDGEYTIDIRGRMGVAGVRPHFQTVRVQATVRTDESEKRLREVVEETEPSLSRVQPDRRRRRQRRDALGSCIRCVTAAWRGGVTPLDPLTPPRLRGWSPDREA